MLRQNKNFRQQSAQSVLEYTIIMGIISLVIITMSTMIKRFAQGTVKMVSDQIGNQVNSDQVFDKKRGYMNRSYSVSQSNMDSLLVEEKGERKKFYNDVTKTKTNTFSDLGEQNTDPYGYGN